MNKILFLCTGNYYRSRFAEHLFNWLAAKQGLEWSADSRALALERGINNIGPMSRYTVEALTNLEITLLDSDRFPKAASESDFQTANLVVAVDETEHRVLMQERFPQWENLVEYWLVHDAHLTSPVLALGQLEKKVVQLVERLAQR